VGEKVERIRMGEYDEQDQNLEKNGANNKKLGEKFTAKMCEKMGM
jgi:hypothetical protein